MNVGTSTPLPSPCEPMPPAVAYRIRTDRASWPAETAGALPTVGVATNAVAAGASVLDTELEPSYGDGVEHAHTMNGLREGHKSCSTSPTPLAELVITDNGQTVTGMGMLAARAVGRFLSGGAYDEADWSLALKAAGVHYLPAPEHTRRARLSRWQEPRQ